LFCGWLKVRAPFVKLQIPGHHAGAQKQEESGEPRNKKDNHDDQMGDSRRCTGRNHAAERMREEETPSTPAAAARTHGSHRHAVGEPKHDRQGTIDNADLADYGRD
jgi:hypothetical protein